MMKAVNTVERVMEMQLRQATAADEARIWELIGQARAFLRQNGTNQWQDGYPDRETIREDIRLGYAHLLADEDGAAVATVAIAPGPDPTYSHIDGAWLTGGDNYAAVHRLAVDNRQKGRGLAAELLRQAEALCGSRGMASLRVDTDETNVIMKRLLTAQGFVRCGVVQVQGSERTAFEKRLS